MTRQLTEFFGLHEQIPRNIRALATQTEDEEEAEAEEAALVA